MWRLIHFRDSIGRSRNYDQAHIVMLDRYVFTLSFAFLFSVAEMSKKVDSIPAPFYRVLSLENPPMEGNLASTDNIEQLFEKLIQENWIGGIYSLRHSFTGVRMQGRICLWNTFSISIFLKRSSLCSARRWLMLYFQRFRKVMRGNRKPKQILHKLAKTPNFNL